MTRAIDAFELTGQGFRNRFAPSRAVSEFVSKRWMEGAVPLVMAFLLSVSLIVFTPVGFTHTGGILDETAEKGLLAIGLTLVMVAGGLDLSIGAIVGFVAIAAQVAIRAWGLPAAVVILLAPIAGAALGAINGLFIAKLRTRPFITTLVTLLMFRGAVKGLQGQYAIELALPRQDELWTFLGTGLVFGIPLSWIILAVTLGATHLLLTRMRWGWWIVSVGSDRRSARRNSVPVNSVMFATYVSSGLLAGVSGLLTAARLGRSDAGTGTGWEVIALTAVVLGGVSLRGGRGSVVRAVIGVAMVAVIQQYTISARLENGWLQVILATALLTFAVVDLKWDKYRPRLAEKLKLDPARVAVGPLVDITEPGSVWGLNRDLTSAPPLGLTFIEGAEDCAVDDDGVVYCGDRRGWIWKVTGPDTGAVFARTGGLPLGHAWDRDGALLVAVGGLGVQRIDADGNSTTLARQVKRNWRSLADDTAIRFADDLDVTPDGAIYVSDFSIRTNAAEYMLELVEYRPNGRIIRIDPDGSTDVVVRNYVFPNGICTSHDGQSVLIASTGLYRVDRLWVSGPKQGQFEPVLENLPGYPDNINRSSDGNYWMSFVAMRSAMSDLVMKYPDFRRRMSKQLPTDEWIVPQLNVSCVVKFDDQGNVLRVLWDETLVNYPMVTSINESDGVLYLCGIQNNRVGMYRIPPDEAGPIDPRQPPGTVDWVGPFASRRAHVGSPA